jgi:Coenzyme PQQ synthesis protein D (PqqD)
MEILSRRYGKSPDVVFRQIAGEFVLVPIRHDVADLEAVYTLGGAGARIWELLDGERDGHAILDEIVQEYDITLDQARSDLIEFLGDLEAVQGIVLVEA